MLSSGAHSNGLNRTTVMKALSDRYENAIFDDNDDSFECQRSISASEQRVLVFRFRLNMIPSVFQMFPAYCRELGSGLSTCFGFTMFYVVIQISPYLLAGVGTSMTFYIFGTVSGVGAIFLYLCLPETKNKAMNDGAT